jgi:hypothetical protein
LLDHFIEGGLPVQIRDIVGLLLQGDPSKARAVAESWQLPELPDADMPALQEEPQPETFMANN